MNSYRNSTKLCQALGINFALEQAKLYNTKANRQLSTVNKDEFVNDKSIKPNLSGINFKIVNCSSGEKNISSKKAKKGFEPFTFCG